MSTLKQKQYWLEHYHDQKYEVIRENILKSFKDLVFDEAPHKYYLNGVELDCVSNITHLFKPHFNTDRMARETFERNFNNENSKYYQMTVEQIKESWQKTSSDACELGSARHNFGESVFWWMVGEYDKIVPEFIDRFTVNEKGERICTPQFPKEEAIVKFWNDLPECYIPILAENKVFNVNENYAYSGTFDILFYYDAELNNRSANQSGAYIMDYKGLSLDTEILTLNGWKTMGTLCEDDFVFDKNGNPCRINHLSEIHNNPCYKIKFDNNDEIVCDHEHRWEVFFYRRHNGYNKIIMTTEELYSFIKNNQRDIYHIPKIFNAKSCCADDINLKIDPYVLGVWLGDGHSACGMITNMYDAIFDEIERRGFKIGVDVSQGGAGKAKSRTVLGLLTLLKHYSLIKNKHIPYEYLLSNYNTKLDLLRGIMDADGYYNNTRGRYVLTTTKEKQVDFCIKLLASMGIKPTVIKAIKKCNNKKIKGYDVTFWIDDYPFLCRQVKISKKPKKDKHSFRNIISVEKVNTVETRCIEVDSNTHTYLCGRGLIPTHNTNKDLYKNFKEQKLLEPFEELLDMPLSIYKLQLAAYQLCLEKIGIGIIARCLIWLRPNGEYEKIRLEDLSKQLHKALIEKLK